VIKYFKLRALSKCDVYAQYQNLDASVLVGWLVRTTVSLLSRIKIKLKVIDCPKHNVS
jgi:hypothetical protein